jgi:hypothetical protein
VPAAAADEELALEVLVLEELALEALVLEELALEALVLEEFGPEELSEEGSQDAAPFQSIAFSSPA